MVESFLVSLWYTEYDISYSSGKAFTNVPLISQKRRLVENITAALKPCKVTKAYVYHHVG